MGETTADSPAADPFAERSRRRCAMALILFTLFGLACRVRQFSADQSFWQDESALMLNVRSKPPLQLISQPLNAVPLSQAAPPMYLLTLKFLLHTLGPREWAMRLPAFACGMAALLCFAAFAWQIAPPPAAAWAAALFACCDGLIFESASVKPYSGDTLAAVVLLWIGMCNASPLCRMIAATIIGLLLLGLAYGTIFVFAAVSLCLLPMLWPSLRGRIGWLAGNAAMGLAFIAIYLLCIRRQRVPMLELFWIDRFAPLGRPLRIPPWLISRLWEVFIYAQPPLGGLLLIAAIGGAMVLNGPALRSRFAPPRAIRWMPILPFVLGALAAIAHAYPLGGGRLSAYLLPPAFLLAGLGIAQFGSAWPATARVVWQAIFGAVLGVSAAFAIAGLVRPQSYGDSRDAVAWLDAHRAAAERVYVIESSREDYLWYAGPIDAMVTIPVMADQTVGADVPAGQSFWVIGANKTRHGRAALDAFAHLPGFTADASRSRQFPGGFAICYRKHT